MEKQCQSLYARLGAAPINSKVWHLKHHSELSFGEANLVAPLPMLVPEHHVSIVSKMPKARSESLAAVEMVEEPSLHGAINEDKATLYTQSMDDIFNNMAKTSNMAWKMQWKW